MISATPVTLDCDTLCSVFSECASVAQLRDYHGAIEAQKCQLFLLEFEGLESHLITSITECYGERYLNALELQGAFGYASHPAEFLALLKEMAARGQCKEIRVTANRAGAGKVLKSQGFELKYAEYGIAL